MNARLLPLLLFAANCLAQFSPFSPFNPPKPATGGGGGGSGFAILTFTNSPNPSDAALNTNAPMDMRGANLAVALITQNESTNSIGEPTLSATGGDTWTVVQSYGTSRNFLRWCYMVNPTQSSAYQLKVTRNDGYPNVIIFAVTNLAGSSTLDLQIGTGGGGFTTIQPGSTTPSATPNLIFSGAAGYQGFATFTVDSGFVILTNAQNGGRSLIYAATNSSSGAINETWTSSSAGNDGGAAKVVFK